MDYESFCTLHKALATLVQTGDMTLAGKLAIRKLKVQISAAEAQASQTNDTNDTLKCSMCSTRQDKSKFARKMKNRFFKTCYGCRSRSQRYAIKIGRQHPYANRKQDDNY